MNIEEIKNILPHRYPFLLIDKIVSISKEKVVAIKNVSANEPFFMGHFPQVAVMPGVLQVEAMAQASGVILSQFEEFNAKKHIGLLAAVENAKFKMPVRPGDQLEIEAELVYFKRGVLKMSCMATVDNEIASVADIIVVVKEISVLE